ncbi:hypothetical protein DRQ36_05855 [bacterium]|nr:MAG: hypothetical protein DRQ36_05855 [bacterium]
MNGRTRFKWVFKTAVTIAIVYLILLMAFMVVERTAPDSKMGNFAETAVMAFDLVFDPILNHYGKYIHIGLAVLLAILLVAYSVAFAGER